MCLNCQLIFVKIMQLLDEFSKISDIQQSENLHVCVFAEILKSTLSTSWTRITFENARIVFSSNWQLSRSTVFVRDDVIFVKNILCIACIVTTHSEPHHHGHNAVAMNLLSWHLVFSKRPLNSCYQFCLQDLLYYRWLQEVEDFK